MANVVRSLLLVCVAGFMSLLAGCGGGEPADAPTVETPTTDAAAPTESNSDEEDSQDAETMALLEKGLADAKAANEARRAEASSPQADVKAAATPEEAVEQLKGMGATITQDESQPDKPVTVVDLFNSKKVSDEQLVHLKVLTELEELNLAMTNIADEGLEHVADLASLKMLVLTGTKVTDAGLAKLKGLENMEHFVAAGYSNELTDKGLEVLKSFPKLHSVSIGGPNVTSASLDHLKGAQLDLLDTLGSRPTDEWLVKIKEFETLRTLNLIGGSITNDGLQHISGMKLDTLNLSQTSIDDSAVPHISKISTLSTLVLQGTKISDDGVTKIKAAIPNCFVLK